MAGRPASDAAGGDAAPTARGAPGRATSTRRASTSSRREIETEIRRRLVADRGREALARSLRKPLPEDIDFMHATRDELASLHRALHPLTRKLAVRLARKRRHGRKGPLDFRTTMRHSLSTGGVPGRAQVPVPAAGQARDLRDRRHLGVGGHLRPLHAAPRVRHQLAVLEGAQLRLRRRHRRGDAVLRGRRRHRRGGAPHQHRGRRDLGGRPLRLRARPRRCSGSAGARRSPHDRACCCSATPATTTTPRRPGCVAGDAAPGPPRLLAQPRAPRLLGHRATRSSASTPPTATTWSSAATCASSSTSSAELA